MCFSRWNPRCCSELKWYVRKLQRKPSLKKTGGTLLSATRSARWIRMAGNCASDAACLWDQQTAFFTSSGVCPGLNRKNSQLQVVSVCCPCYILYYNIGIFTCTTVTFFFFFNKQLRVGSSIVCTSYTLGTLTKESHNNYLPFSVWFWGYLIMLVNWVISETCISLVLKHVSICFDHIWKYTLNNEFPSELVLFT